jgi:hypothetical protein
VVAGLIQTGLYADFGYIVSLDTALPLNLISCNDTEHALVGPILPIVRDQGVAWTEVRVARLACVTVKMYQRRASQPSRLVSVTGQLSEKTGLLLG